MENAIAKTGILIRKSGMLRRKERRFFLLTNAGGLFYAKGIAQEFDGLKTLVNVTRASDIIMERSGSSNDSPMVIKIYNRAVLKGLPVELEAMSDEETYSWGQAMSEVVELLGFINGDRMAALPRPLQGLKMGSQGWYLEPTGRMALYELNRVGMWTVREKREYDEATVLHWMAERTGGGGGVGGVVGGIVGGGGGMYGQALGGNGGQGAYPHNDDQATASILAAKANAGGTLTDAEMQALQARGIMSQTVPSQVWQGVPQQHHHMSPAALTTEYIHHPVAAVRSRSGGSVNGVGIPVAVVPPPAGSINGSVHSHNGGSLDLSGGGAGGSIVVAGGGGVGGAGVGFAADVPTVLPSTFAVGKGDGDDADSLVLRRGGRRGSEEGDEDEDGGGDGGRWMSPAMELLQSSMIA